MMVIRILIIHDRDNGDYSFMIVIMMIMIVIMMVIIVIMMIHDLGISNGQMVKSPQAGSGWMHDVLRENFRSMASSPTEI